MPKKIISLYPQPQLKPQQPALEEPVVQPIPEEEPVTPEVAQTEAVLAKKPMQVGDDEWYKMMGPIAGPNPKTEEKLKYASEYSDDEILKIISSDPEHKFYPGENASPQDTAELIRLAREQLDEDQKTFSVITSPGFQTGAALAGNTEAIANTIEGWVGLPEEAPIQDVVNPVRDFASGRSGITPFISEGGAFLISLQNPIKWVQGGFKLMRGVKSVADLSKFTRNWLAPGIAAPALDAVMFEPDDANLSAWLDNKVDGTPWEDKVGWLTEMLATDPDSPEWENRIKRAVESGLVDSLLWGTGRTLKGLVDGTARVDRALRAGFTPKQPSSYSYADTNVLSPERAAELENWLGTSFNWKADTFWGRVKAAWKSPYYSPDMLHTKVFDGVHGIKLIDDYMKGTGLAPNADNYVNWRLAVGGSGFIPEAFMHHGPLRLAARYGLSYNKGTGKFDIIKLGTPKGSEKPILPEVEIDGDLGTIKIAGRTFGFDEITPQQLDELRMGAAVRPLGSATEGEIFASFDDITKAQIEVSRLNAMPNLEFTGNKALNEIWRPLEATGQMAKFFAYLTAKRTKALMAENPNYKTLMDDATANDIILDGEARTFEFDGKEYSFTGLAEEMNKFNTDLLTFVKQSGVISDDGLKFLTERGLYIPLYRFMDPEKLTIPGRIEKKPTEKGRIGLKLKEKVDSEAIYENPIHAYMLNTSSLVQAAYLNLAKKGLYEQIDLINKVFEGKMDPFAVKTDTGVKLLALQSKEVLDSVNTLLRKGGYDTIDELPPEMVFLFQGLKTKRGQDIDVVFRDGRPEAWKITDPVFAEAISMFGPRASLLSNSLVRTMATPAKRFFTATTTYAPSFIWRAMLRDPVSAAIFTSNKSFLPFIESIRGIYERTFNDKDYMEFLINGGGFSGYYHGNLDSNLRRMAMSMAKLDPKKLLEPSTIMEKFAAPAQFVESLNRLREYQKSVAAGEFKSRAAYAGREVGVDFGLQGSGQFIQAAAAALPFFNPGLQGFRKFAQHGFTKAKAKKFWTRAFMIAGTASIINYLMNRENPHWQKLPHQMKYTNWFFYPGNYSKPVVDMMSAITGTKVDNPFSMEDPFTMPVPYEVGAFFQAVMGATDGFIKNQPELAAHALNYFFGNFFRLDPTPQAIKPWLGIETNEDWLGRPIYSNQIEPVEPRFQYDPTKSSDFMTWALSSPVYEDMTIANTTGLDPTEAEYYVKGYASLIGTGILDFADWMTRVTTGDKGEDPHLRIDEIPLVKTILKQNPMKISQSEIDFYQIYDKVTEIDATAKLLTNDKNIIKYDPKVIEDYISKDYRAIIIGGGTSVFKEIMMVAGAIKDEMSRTTVDKDMSGKEKYDRLQELMEQKNRLFINFMDTLENDDTLNYLMAYKYTGLAQLIARIRLGNGSKDSQNTQWMLGK